MTIWERFMAFVSPEPNTGCWLWTGWSDSDGYGKMWGRGKNILATHVALGGEAGGRFALHSCDQPGCVNPSHLRWGTQKENIADAMRRGRRDRVRPPVRRGERNNRAKLTREQVLQMRSRRAAGVKVRDIAAEFGVGYGNAKQVCAGKTWRWLTSDNSHAV